jgi:hypothetical protein
VAHQVARVVVQAGQRQQRRHANAAPAQVQAIPRRDAVDIAFVVDLRQRAQAGEVERQRCVDGAADDEAKRVARDAGAGAEVAHRPLVGLCLPDEDERHAVAVCGAGAVRAIVGHAGGLAHLFPEATQQFLAGRGDGGDVGVVDVACGACRGRRKRQWSLFVGHRGPLVAIVRAIVDGACAASSIAVDDSVVGDQPDGSRP